MKIKVGEADNTLRDLHNSLDDTKAECDNRFIIHSNKFLLLACIDVKLTFNCLLLASLGDKGLFSTANILQITDSLSLLKLLKVVIKTC